MVVREVEIGHPLHTIIEKRYWLNLPQIGFTHRLVITTIETRGLLPHQQFMCKTPLHLRHHLTKVVHGRRLRTTTRLALALPLHHTLTHRGVRTVLRRLGVRLQVLALQVLQVCHGQDRLRCRTRGPTGHPTTLLCLTTYKLAGNCVKSLVRRKTTKAGHLHQVARPMMIFAILTTKRHTVAMLQIANEDRHRLGRGAMRAMGRTKVSE
jgi:hypothetical protein